MAESFGVEDRGHFYDRVGALQDVVVNHLMQLLAMAAMEAPAGADAKTLKDAKYALFRSIADADPRPLRPRPVRRLPRHRRRGAGLDHRDLRGAAAGDRQLALGRGAVLHPHRQAAADHPDRAARRCSAGRRGWASSRVPGHIARGGQLVVKLDPIDRRATAARRAARRPAGSRSRSRSTWSSPRRAARGRRPTRCCCRPRWTATARRSRARTASRRPGGSWRRCSTRRRRCTPTRPEAGARRRPSSCSPGVGRWHEPWVAS